MKNFFSANKYLVLACEVLVIIWLILLIRAKLDIHKKTVYNSISNADLINKSKSLSFFYEPKPNSIQENVSNMPSTAKYRINADSLNERRNYPLDKEPSVYRIITLGDSYTYGLYVNTADNWTEVLEDKLNHYSCKENKFEVINLGVQGYDIQYSSERYRLRGRKYKPNLVLWYLKNDDFEQINELFRGREKEIREQMMKSGEFKRAIERKDYYPSWTKAMQEIRSMYPADKLSAFQSYQLQKFAADYSVPVIFMIQPDLSKSNLAILQQFTRKHSSYSILKIGDFYRNPKAYFEEDYHPNKLGHKLIANDVYRYLTKQTLSFCSF